MEHNLYDDLDFPELLNMTPAFPIITPADEELLKILPSELKALNARLEYLEKGLSVQSLRLEIERAKRQKLSLSIKPTQTETSSFQLDNLKQTMDTNFMHQNTINFQLQGDTDRLNTLTFRCLSRMQQLLSFILPNVTITPSDQPDTTILLEEIGRTLQQLCVLRSTTTTV